jgi:murein L,D-transpeptidase YcbB/YkuD
MTLTFARRLPCVLCLFAGAALLALLLALSPGAARAADSADSTAFRQAVAEAASENPVLADFYRLRDQAPLWTTGADAPRRAAFFAALDRAADHGLPPSRYDAAGLRAAFASLASERQRGRLEVRMTQTFLTFARDLQTGILTPANVDAGIVREVVLRDPLAMLRGFAAAEPAAFIRDLPPDAPQYTLLMKALHDLHAVVDQGGWGPGVRASRLEPGAAGPDVVALRDRLIAMGYLRQTASQTFDARLQKAVQLFQIDHGLVADGVAGEGTIAEINVPPEVRMQAVAVALERLRWMNGLELGSRHIWVNLPDFTAKIVDDGKVTFETVTVVGMNQSDRRSPEFSDRMEFMVINPTWNVPRSITVKEYLPQLQKNPNSVRHLRIVDRRGRVVDRSAVDFTQFTAANFPFSMSQPPSDDNALGLVKFMFPNQWNIYLHDTPSKSLFEKEVRAYSHGCIRLGRPFEFAYALLAAQTDDPVGLFQTNLANKREHPLPLEKAVPVHLVYFTAWPDARGRVEFRRDVYGRDGRIYEALSAAGVALPAVQG